MEALQQQLGDAREQLAGALDFVMADLRQKWAEMSGGPSVTEGVRAFVAAVDWSERWIQGLLAAHALLLVVAVAYRRNGYVQGSLFLGIMPLVYFAERLNRLGARHWRSFAGQDYFDPHGVFASALLSAPLLLVMFVILINYLFTTSALLIRLKRQELLYRARQQRKAERAADATTGAAAGSGGEQAPAAAGAAGAGGSELKKRR